MAEKFYTLYLEDWEIWEIEMLLIEALKEEQDPDRSNVIDLVLVKISEVSEQAERDRKAREGK